MKSKRVYLVLGGLLAYAIFIFFVSVWALTPQSPRSRLEEERKLYSTIVKGSDVLQAKTYVGGSDYSKQSIDYIKSGLPGLEQETLNDFQDINSETYSLQDYFPMDSGIVFLSDAELQYVFEAGWDAFDKKYPSANGIISLSRIGFNSRFSQALLVEGSSGPSDYGAYSEGTFILLENKRGLWTVIEELPAWVS